MEFFIIGDRDTVTGFSLGGIEGISVDNPEEANSALKEVMGYEGIGIVLITERFAQRLRSEIDDVMVNQRIPLIVEIPDVEGPMEEKVTISDLVKSAIGVKI